MTLQICVPSAGTSRAVRFGVHTTPRRILVPYDFTACSKRACDRAVELTAAIGGSLTLDHVVASDVLGHELLLASR